MEQLAIRDRLRNETAARHKQLEHRLNILDGQLCMARYGRILTGFLDYYGPLEQRLRARMPRLLRSAPEFRLPLPNRAPLLLADVIAIGASLSGTDARSVTLPPLTRVEQAAGCLYVLEGAALGGRVIARALERDLGLRKDTGASFFVGSEDSGYRWKQTLQWLDDLAREKADTDAIVASAERTFATLHAWLERRGATQ